MSARPGWSGVHVQACVEGIPSSVGGQVRGLAPTTDRSLFLFQFVFAFNSSSRDWRAALRGVEGPGCVGWDPDRLEPSPRGRGSVLLQVDVALTRSIRTTGFTGHHLRRHGEEERRRERQTL